MFRPYDPERDRAAAGRIWQEVGWLQDDNQEGFDLFLRDGRTLVADIDNQAECMVIMMPGTIRYQEDDLPLAVVGAVTTSRIARKQKFASRLTALSIANEAAKGFLVSGLGMFEQGYYNRLGFGSGPYVHAVSFDPADLLVKTDPRVPRRITKDDWEAVHASRVSRLKGHGAVTADSSLVTQGEMIGDKKGFGLGYYDGPNGELTHHVWISPEDVCSGPYSVRWAVWQTGEQFMELMALLKSMGDQVHLVNMNEPPEIQIQDLMHKPAANRCVRKGSKFEMVNKAVAYWQMRILDLPGCMVRTHLANADVRFNLELTDPIEGLLDADAPWHGVGGNYIVTLGQESEAVPGADASLPTLSASVNAFTRMWMGVRPASGLAITDDLSGPDDLLRKLDSIFLLPTPYLGWDI